jgi:1,2-dihydroxy-3-keto-5-methylthiopentene dioxygenase
LNYTYQPCSDFTTELCKTATAICQSNDTAGVGVNCGTARNATFVYDNSDNYVSLQYENGDKVNGRARKSVVRLVCNDSVTIPQLTALGDFFATDVYEFKLVSKHCCPVPYQLQARYFSMSIGSLLIILFFSLVFLYFVGGALYMKFARGAKGKEIIPNQRFWSSLPGLIRDGLMLTTQTCRTTNRGYEKL